MKINNFNEFVHAVENRIKVRKTVDEKRRRRNRDKTFNEWLLRCDIRSNMMM